jgi:tetratricopeptide (TPR) repeat protein
MTSLLSAVVQRPENKRRAAFGMAGVVVVLVAVVAYVLWNRPTLAFEDKDRLLIASVDNQTEEEAFDLALRAALESDLRQSTYANVYGQSQVIQALQLMRLDPSTPVTEELGRDICRFAGIRALILPRILAVGDAFELQAILVDPVSGRHVDTIRVSARGREEVLLSSIDDLSRQVRNRLGESLESIEAADMPISMLATSSWEALKYLAMSNIKWIEGEFAEAAALLELSLQKDPEFASAKGSLGLLLIQFLGEKERGQQLLRESLEDAQDLPEREYLMIRAVNKQFVEEDLEAALDEYKLVLELYPDFMPAANNTGRILLALGRYDEAVAPFERAAETDPQSTIPVVNLFFLHIQYRKDPVSAEPWARRVIEIAPHVASYHGMLGWNLAVLGQLDEALHELRQAVEAEPRNRFALPNLAHVLYSTGADEEAAERYREIYDLSVTGEFDTERWIAGRDLAIALVSSGESDQAWDVVNEEIEWRRSDIGGEPLAAEDHLAFAQLLAAVGSAGEAREHVEGAERLGVDSATSIMHLAQAYALLGDNDRVIEEVARALEMDYPDPFLPMILPAFRTLHGDPRFGELFGLSEGAAQATGDPEEDPSVIVPEDSKTGESGGSTDEWW